MNKKIYGNTTPKCWYCNEPAMKRNKDGLPCCNQHFNIVPDIKCPICKNELVSRISKFGGYFHCIICKVNYSLNKIRKFI